MFARHDLIWLTRAGWDAQLAAPSVPAPVLAWTPTAPTATLDQLATGQLADLVRVAATSEVASMIPAIARCRAAPAIQAAPTGQATSISQAAVTIPVVAPGRAAPTIQPAPISQAFLTIPVVAPGRAAPTGQAALTGHAAPVLPAAAMPPVARQVMERWRNRGWPLIVRRREPGVPQASICAGLAAPPDPATGHKLRIPLVVQPQHIARHERPLPLQAVLPALPACWQAAFARFAAEAGDFDMRVYGSLAMQALTDQPYLRETSDIDIVFQPIDAPALDQGVALLAKHALTLPLDGEIVFTGGDAVAWKEWHAADAASASSGGSSGMRVLAKQPGSVQLRPVAALRSKLEAA